MVALRRTPNLAIVESGDHATVLALDGLTDTSAPLQLSGSALMIWDLIDGTRSAAEVVDALSGRFPDVELRAETEAFIEELKRTGLITDE